MDGQETASLVSNSGYDSKEFQSIDREYDQSHHQWNAKSKENKTNL